MTPDEREFPIAESDPPPDDVTDADWQAMCRQVHDLEAQRDQALAVIDEMVVRIHAFGPRTTTLPKRDTLEWLKAIQMSLRGDVRT